MDQYIKSMSQRAEFLIVVLVAFGYFIFGNILAIIDPGVSTRISNAHLRFLIIDESVIILVLWKFLSLRGWDLEQVGFVPTVRDTLIGFGLFIAAYLAYAAIWDVSSVFVPGLREQATGIVASNLNLPTVLIVSVLNPVFEEVFVCGYIIAALSRTRSIAFAVNVSIGIRLAYHLYQGTAGVIGIIPLGIIFAFWFVKTGRLWPVVIAHGFFDLLSLTAYVRM